MSINSSDLHVLVARAGETDKVAAHRERSVQTGIEVAVMGQKSEAEKIQHRVQDTPKTEGGKITREHRRHGQQGHHDKQPDDNTGQRQNIPHKKAGRNSGNLIDIKI